MTQQLKTGDKVVMHTCDEAEHYEGRIWTCRSDQFKAANKEQVVFLEGFSGYFVADYLQKVDIQSVSVDQQKRAEAAEQERDKLLAIVEGIYGAALNDVNRWEGGMTVGTPVFQDRVFVKHLVRDLQPFIFAEGSKPDGE